LEKLDNAADEVGLKEANACIEYVSESKHDEFLFESKQSCYQESLCLLSFIVAFKFLLIVLDFIVLSKASKVFNAQLIL
jgi:hypothetical protein